MIQPCLHVIVQYCNDPRPARQAEYDACVRRNLSNPYVKAVHNLVEPQTIVPDDFRSHEKYRHHDLPRWMRYGDAFSYANEKLPGEIVCLCNLDIALDPNSNWHDAAATARNNIVLCLSRTELNADGTTFEDPMLKQMAFANTQDAWLWLAPLDVPDADFELGTMGCDNAIAHRIKQAGHIPINLGSQFRVLHLDRARGKDYANAYEVHAADLANRPSPHAEDHGHYLLPDFHRLKSLDEVVRALNLDEVQRYTLICDLLSRFIKMQHPRS
jgi:hypothetical protein